jgi:hypothetical protein
MPVISRWKVKKQVSLAYTNVSWLSRGSSGRSLFPGLGVGASGKSGLLCQKRVELFFLSTRSGRINQLIRAADGILNLQSAMSILQDKIDLPSSQVRNIGSTIAVHTTMTSAIVLPERGMIYVANGQAPVSRNSYVQLPTIEAFDSWRLPNDNLEIPNNQFPQKVSAVGSQRTEIYRYQDGLRVQ